MRPVFRVIKDPGDLAIGTKITLYGAPDGADAKSAVAVSPAVASSLDERKLDLDVRPRQNAVGQLRFDRPVVDSAPQPLQAHRRELHLERVSLGGVGVLDLNRATGVGVVVISLRGKPDGTRHQRNQ